MYDQLFELEHRLAEFTGAPYVVLTTGCSHAIELCMRYQIVKTCRFTAYTYLSIPQTLRNLYINFELIDERWTGELHHRRRRPGARQGARRRAARLGTLEKKGDGKIALSHGGSEG